MYDVDDEAVSGGPHGDWPCAHQQGDDVEQVGQVAHHVQRVVERQHQQVPATTVVHESWARLRLVFCTLDALFTLLTFLKN